ncbi:NAD-dependent succinate-semialdehyde dehydrogenase [Thauera sp. SDU_THAU2]|uniref:NAD-dependent succinate-semialdehyde dehydrogenase n=1 Tax=Thauera sp. SDU_THAU2 TaxID=3136633 RepID=UPI003120300C
MQFDLEEMNKGLYIGGVWRAAEDGSVFDVLDPATEETIARVSDATVGDAIAAVDAAYGAAKGWASTPPRERSEMLRRAFELMVEEKDALAWLITLESGKALSEARGEVLYAAEFLRWFSEEAVRVIGEISVAPSGNNRIVVQRQPIGISVFVTPWNFPAAMATRKIAPALAAGCTTVLKPAKETPLTALAMAAIFERAGVPPGVVNTIPTRRSSSVVAAMLKDARVRKFSFTGSTETGRRLLAQAAENVVKCSMELGGNAPFIVFADADLDAAVSAAMIAKLRNGGESCTAANRFYVESPVAREFADRLAAAMAGVKIGHGLDDGVQLGPMVNAGTRDKVASLVKVAIAEGATLIAGGKVPDGPGYFYEPTVLADVAADATILREEIFGPVAPIATFEGEEQAVALANATEFGLVSFIHTRDLAKALRVADRIESGMVGINRGVVSDPAAPFGGWKQSGVGREGAHDGLLEYLESKYISVSW